jgi:ketosteroid isomerase-like protein
MSNRIQGVRRTVLTALFLGLSSLIGATQPALAAEPMKLADASAIFAVWIKAYETRDAEKLMSIFDKSLVYSAQGEADQNFTELKANYVNYFASRMPPTRWKAIPKEIQTQAGLAVVVSIWEQRLRAASGAGELIARVRSVDVFRQTKAGWKIIRTVNYPEAN